MHNPQRGIWLERALAVGAQMAALAVAGAQATMQCADHDLADRAVVHIAEGGGS